MARKRSSNHATRNLVGRDLARLRLSRRRTTRPMAALLAGLLLAGLGLAVLRVDILRLRYALADAIETEQTMLGDQRVATARRESLRDPTRLAELARERGFARPTQMIDLRPVRVASGLLP